MTFETNPRLEKLLEFADAHRLQRALLSPQNDPFQRRIRKRIAELTAEKPAEESTVGYFPSSQVASEGEKPAE